MNTSNKLTNLLENFPTSNASDMTYAQKEPLGSLTFLTSNDLNGFILTSFSSANVAFSIFALGEPFVWSHLRNLAMESEVPHASPDAAAAAVVSGPGWSAREGRVSTYIRTCDGLSLRILHPTLDAKSIRPSTRVFPHPYALHGVG